jgi:hypothetical protein
MPTLHTQTLPVTIDAPLSQVATDLADPTTHPSWATEFYAGPVRPAPDGEFIAPVPMMGGQVRHKLDADPARGILDLYYAPWRTLWPPHPGPAGPQRRRGRRAVDPGPFPRRHRPGLAARPGRHDPRTPGPQAPPRNPATHQHTSNPLGDRPANPAPTRPRGRAAASSWAFHRACYRARNGCARRSTCDRSQSDTIVGSLVKQAVARHSEAGGYQAERRAHGLR